LRTRRSLKYILAYVTCPTNQRVQGEATRMLLHGPIKTQLEKVCLSSAKI